MAASLAVSTVHGMAEKPQLVCFPRYDVYKCLKCGEEIECPMSVKRDPFHRLQWLESVESMHKDCR